MIELRTTRSLIRPVPTKVTTGSSQRTSRPLNGGAIKVCHSDLGLFVLLAGALALGGWSAHEQQRQSRGHSRAAPRFRAERPGRGGESQRRHDYRLVARNDVTLHARRTSSRAPAATSTSATSISAITSSRDNCWRKSSPPSSIIKSSKRKPLSSSTKPRYARTRRTGTSRRSL